MELLKYCCDEYDFGICRSRVKDKQENLLGNLMYCPKCGKIKIKIDKNEKKFLK